MTTQAMTSVDASPSSLEDALRAALGSHERDERASAIREASATADPEVLVVLMGDHADSISRNAAMDALTRGGTRSLSALVRALRHPDPEVVMFAAGVLGKTRDRAAVPHLVGLLTHLDVNVVQQAIESLSQLRASSAVGALVATLDEDPWLRFAAVHALGEIGDGRAVGPLAALLADEIVREEVIAALGKIGSPDALDHLAQTLRESADPTSFAVCLRAIGTALDRHPDHELSRAVGAWAGLRGPDAEAVHERLVQILTSDTPDAAHESEDAPDVRPAAAALIHALRLRHLYTALVLAWRDTRLRETLEFYVLSLGTEIVPTLHLGLSVGRAGVRRLACVCLGALGCENEAPSIAARLGDEDPEVRVAALEALGSLRGARHAHRMVPLLVDDHADVRQAALSTLATLDSEVVTLALVTARPQHPSDLLPTLEIMRANPHPDQQQFIERCLGHAVPEVRVAAVTALAVQRGDVVARVARAADDPERVVRRAALTTIAMTRTPLARRILLQALETQPERLADVVSALGELRDAAVVPQLVRLLAAPIGGVRQAAVTALGRFVSAMVLRHLAAAARDSDACVREEVARVLSTSDDPVALAALERLGLDPNGAVADVARSALARDA